MSQNTLSQPPRKDDGRFDDWIYRLWKRVAGAAQILWNQIDLTGAEFVGDSGSGGQKGIVPAPAAGDASKFLKGNGTWATVSGGSGSAIASNVISSDTTIDADTSYIVLSYLTVTASLTVNGNLGVIAAGGSSPVGGGGGSGDVVGPSSATNNAVVVFDGTTGKLIKQGAAGSDYVKPDTATNFTATQRPDYGTASISTTSTHTFDGADQIREFTLTNTITVTFGAPTGITQYAMYKFILKAGDTSARTFSWNSAYKFPSAVSALTNGTTTNGAFDIITFIGGASNTLIFEGVCRDVR